MESLKEVYVGIKREDYSDWEIRAPLIPRHIKEIQQNNPYIKFIVQPCGKRSIPMISYEKAGCIIQEDMSLCSLILGIKRPKNADSLLANKSYMFFGHVIKGQESNADILKVLLEKKIRFFDIECIKNERGKRLLYFGRFGGIAGAIDFLGGFGEYLLKMGYSTPFLHISLAYQYSNIAESIDHMGQIGNLVVKKRLPLDICPLIIAVIGDGKVASGVWEILQSLPIKNVQPDELERLCKDKKNPLHRTTIYVKPKKSRQAFYMNDYCESPHNFQPIFHEKYLPYISIIFNAIYWEPKFPRLITNSQIKNLVQADNSRLIGVCDITCDLNGSIQFLKKYTTPDNHFYIYDPINGSVNDKIEYKPNHILYMSFDSLPCELPDDSSNHCSTILTRWVHSIISSDQQEQYYHQDLPLAIRNSMITSNGELTPKYRYISKLKLMKKISANSNYSGADEKDNKINLFLALKLTGDLFDTKGINQIYEVLQNLEIKANISDIEVGITDDKQSQIIIQIFANDPKKIQIFNTKLNEICSKTKIVVEDLLKSGKFHEISQMKMKL